VSPIIVGPGMNKPSNGRRPNRDATFLTGKIMLPVLRLIVLLLALGPIVYYLLSLYCIIGYFRALRKVPPRSGEYTPPASILKPARGVDRDAYENFASFCRLDYPEYELIFAASDVDDPAIPIIQKLQRDFPACAIRLIAPAEHVGVNRKINNLCSAVKAAKYDLLVMSDTDVRVQKNYLREVAAPFVDPAVGGTTSFYHCLGGGNVVADLNMLGMSMDSVPGALIARRLEGNVRFAFGWTMATTKKVLAEIGGWESMANYQSDDFELGNRIANRGYRVEIIHGLPWMVFPAETIRQFISHEMRWTVGLRHVRPAGYAGMIFTLGLPWALLAVIAAITAGWYAVAASYLSAYLVLRIAATWAAGVWGLGDRSIARKLWLVPLRDAIYAGVWVAALFSNRVEWRGWEYRVENGMLVEGRPQKSADARG
jgi:ceramide glucosyltransferase